MDSHLVDAYLNRTGAGRPTAADATTLRDLHLRHQRAVPFENLSVHLGQDIALDGPALAGKITGGRGGFCYELNGAFAELLGALGYRVTPLAARVYGDGGRLGPPYDHLALRVDAADGSGPWLADVGFGRHAHYPLRLGVRDDQHDPDGVFRIEETADGDLRVLRDGEPRYLLETRPRRLSDFEATCWWQRTSPKSHFRQSLVCSLLTERGRVTLSGRKLVLTEDGRREEYDLRDSGEVLAAYREHFGITLDAEPVVAPLDAP